MKYYLFQLLKKNVMQIIHAEVPQQMPNVDFSAIQLTLAEKQSELPQTCKTGIPVIISMPEKSSNRYEY